jgi:hypothetical protein
MILKYNIKRKEKKKNLLYSLYEKAWEALHCTDASCVADFINFS